MLVQVSELPNNPAYLNEMALVKNRPGVNLAVGAMPLLIPEPNLFTLGFGSFCTEALLTGFSFRGALSNHELGAPGLIAALLLVAGSGIGTLLVKDPTLNQQLQTVFNWSLTGMCVGVAANIKIKK